MKPRPGEAVSADPLLDLMDRLVNMRRDVVEQLAGLDHLDGGLLALLAQTQAAIEAVAAVKAAG